MTHDPLEQAARLLRGADALLVCAGAGAGMGVDSGLPDFRGSQGFWQAYPALRASGIVFHEIANPAAFDADPLLAWGFYGHRLQPYRATLPHAGFDGDRIVECHVSIHHLQCTRPCSNPTWAADAFAPVIDAAACRLHSAPPACPRCGAPAPRNSAAMQVL